MSTEPSELKIEEEEYESSIDNLIRVRCITSYIEEKEIEADGNISVSFWPSGENEVTFDHRYDSVCMTSLGVGFVEACTNPKRVQESA